MYNIMLGVRKMTKNISDFIEVSNKLEQLGCACSEGIAILPVNFETAKSTDGFKQLSEASTVKTLFRNNQIPFSEIKKTNQKSSYIQNNAFEWIAPTLFVSGAFLSQNPEAVAIALSVIANYVTDFFRGFGGEKNIKLDIIVEKTKSKTCKKISYEGNIDGLKDLAEIVKEVGNEQ
jgi:hypothetical protein